MLPFTNALFGAAKRDALPKPPGGIVVLTLDFASGNYRVGETEYESLAEMPDYVFARSGEQGADFADGAVAWFPSDVPAISDRGFHAYGAATNLLTHSQDFAGAWWVEYGSGTVKGSTSLPAPDGSASAGSVSWPGGSSPNADKQLYHGMAYPAAGPFTFSSFVGSNAAGDQAFRLKQNAYGDVLSPNMAGRADWRRFAFAQDFASGGFGNVSFANANDGGSAADIAVWQAQLLDGDFTDGGPIIRTNGATASVGESQLTVAIANGAYVATFTFDDGGEQVLPVAVEDGLFRHPVFGVLEQGVVRRTILYAS